MTGTAALDEPDVVQAGFAYKMTPDLTLLGEFDFYTWSNFQQIAVHTTSPLIGNLVTTENYRDSYSFSLGAEYQLDPQWRLRGRHQVRSDADGRRLPRYAGAGQRPLLDRNRIPLRL